MWHRKHVPAAVCPTADVYSSQPWLRSENPQGDKNAEELKTLQNGHGCQSSILVIREFAWACTPRPSDQAAAGIAHRTVLFRLQHSEQLEVLAVRAASRLNTFEDPQRARLATRGEEGSELRYVLYIHVSFPVLKLQTNEE